MFQLRFLYTCALRVVLAKDIMKEKENQAAAVEVLESTSLQPSVLLCKNVNSCLKCYHAPKASDLRELRRQLALFFFGSGFG